VIGSNLGREEPRDGWHVEGLDGVRGLAVLLVLARHLSLVEPAASAPVAAMDAVLFHTWMGVDLFFVLSGFLITRILLRSRGTHGYALNFYARRVLRIFPLYFFALFLVTFVLAMVVPPLLGRIVTMRWYEWAAFLTFTRNLQQAACLPSPPTDSIGLGHFWSLQVEEQFYLLWPLLVATLSSRALVRVCIGCVLGCEVARLLCLGMSDPKESYQWIFWMTFTRADGLAAGACVALVLERYGVSAEVLRAARRAAIFSAVVVLAAAVLDSVAPSHDARDDVWTLRLAMPAVAVGCSWLLLEVLAAPPGSPFTRFFGLPPLTWLGRRSYGIYVYHQILNLDLFGPLGLRASLGARSSFFATEAYAAIVTAISLVVAAVSYRYFESPFLRLKRYFVTTPAPAKGAAPARA
jgi:peptidoglycan/LPS O-acetylase OafA/YrhL